MTPNEFNQFLKKNLKSLLLLLILLPVAFLAIRQVTLLRSQAITTSASILLSPSAATLPPDKSVTVQISTTGLVGFIDLEITFDPAKIKLANQTTPLAVNPLFQRIIKLTTKEDANLTGKINMVLGINPEALSPQTVPLTGTFDVLTLPFSPTSTTANDTTQININSGKALLVDTSAAKINISGIQNANITLNPTSPSPTTVVTPGPTTSIYVSPTGSDTNSGTLQSPLKTLARAISLAQPGSIIRVQPGTYRENLKITGKNGTPSAPIRLVGNTTDPNLYPVIDGGDPTFTAASNPAFNITNSSWWTFERLKIINSTDMSYYLDNSHYITVRRNILDFHKEGIKLKNRSSHVLVEYNEFYQSWPDSSTWSQLKGSKWESGAYGSFGGAGMIVIRYNYFHHLVNGVVLYNQSSSGNYYDANVWIYRNRFENIVDDPYEPESYAFNNHFFQNTLINTHRMVSLAPGGSAPILGPIYIYNNMQITTSDPTKEAYQGRANSAFKVSLASNYYRNGVFAFNNSVEMSTKGINGYGVDTLNTTINKFTHINNLYRTEKPTFLKSNLTLVNSLLDYDMSQTSLNYNEPHGFPNTEPLYSNLQNEDLRLTANSPARGKSSALNFTLGFTSTFSIPQGSDLGAFVYGATDFRSGPPPVYTVPPGGEYSSFPANHPWPADSEGGINPLSGPKWRQL